jgi:tetratricopeptide (TPR) repeat protein
MKIKLTKHTKEIEIGNVFKPIAKISGVGGISLLVLMFVYRDLIFSKLFPTMEPEQGALLILAIIGLTFFAVIIASYVWLVKHEKKEIGRKSFFYILLVALLLMFLLIIIYYFQEGQLLKIQKKTEPSPYYKGDMLIKSGKYAEAERLFNKLMQQYPKQAYPVFWKAKLAMSQGNNPIALRFIRKSLRIDPQHEPSLVMFIKLLLLSGEQKQIVEAREVVSRKAQISEEFRIWTTCLINNNIFSCQLITETMLNSKCLEPTFEE